MKTTTLTSGLAIGASLLISSAMTPWGKTQAQEVVGNVFDKDIYETIEDAGSSGLTHHFISEKNPI